MEKEKIIIELSNNIELVKTHVSRLKKYTYNVNKLDVDMLKQKTIEFYELVFELEKTLSTSTFEGDEIVPDNELDSEETFIPEEKAIGMEVILEETPKENEILKEELIEEVKKAEEVFDEIVDENTLPPDPEPLIINQPSVTEQPMAKEQTEDNTIEQNKATNLPPQTTYDLFSGSSENAVAEKFQAKEEQSFADKMLKSSVSNIREAIGINEKFLFINELFNGDLGKYNKILDEINVLPTKKGVDTYLLEMKIQYQWSDKNEAFIKLKELLNRKFI